jgi:hypothetical protein
VTGPHTPVRRRGALAGALLCTAAAFAAVGGFAQLANAGPAAAKAAAVKPLTTWTGRVPLGVQPPLVSSLATPQALRQVWALCQVKGDVPQVDFRRHLVVLAARRSSAVRFRGLALDDGNLKTDVVVAPDMPNYTTCALALVPREGIARVNGAPPGQ